MCEVRTGLLMNRTSKRDPSPQLSPPAVAGKGRGGGGAGVSIGWVLMVLVALGRWEASACDLCAVYAASEARGEIGKGWFGGVAEQFTHYGTLQEDGHEVANPADQYLDSSITQILLGYNFTERVGVQVNLPVIYRSFRRPEGPVVEQDTEAGLGDLSLLGNFQLWRRATVHSTLAWSILGGVKFPTGSTSRLEEETQEIEPAPGDIASGIHGHDLTLGSGSYDGIVGTSIYARWKRLFLAAATQYAIRTQGDFDYRFANDLTWSGGPGLLALLEDDYSLAIQAVVSGETKDRDEFRGAAVEDTGIESVYLGPQILFTWRDNLSAQIAVDVPVRRDNTALQIVPDYRIRAALTWHF